MPRIPIGNKSGSGAPPVGPRRPTGKTGSGSSTPAPTAPASTRLGRKVGSGRGIRKPLPGSRQ